jgi:Putative zinc-finger
VCTRYQTDGMRLLDGELSPAENSAYEAHVRECETCQAELKSLGRVVGLTGELRLRVPDDEFWNGYWESVYRRSERNVGFLSLVAGLLALLGYALFRAVTSPRFLTFEGISVTLIIAGFMVIFISVARERYHESKNDPYRGVQR